MPPPAAGAAACRGPLPRLTPFCLGGTRRRLGRTRRRLHGCARATCRRGGSPLEPPLRAPLGPDPMLTATARDIDAGLDLPA